MKTCQRALIAFSLANLCFIRTWSEILEYSPADTFYMAAPPSRAQYAAALADVLLLGLLLFAAASLAHRRGGWVSKVARWAFFGMLLIPLNGIRELLSRQFPWLRANAFRIVSPTAVGFILAAGAALLLVVLILRQRSLVVNLSRVVLLISPLALLTTCRAGLGIVRAQDAAFASSPLAPPLPDRARQPRVMLINFDEWDYRLSFEDRLPGLNLPDVDRLRETALFATRVHTASTSTGISIPSMLTGRLTIGSRARGTSELLVRLAGESGWARLDRLPNIFSHARALGLNTAVVGWYLPYCRIFSESLTSCSWWEMPRQWNSTGSSFVANAMNEPRSWFETSLFSVFGQSLVETRSSATYSQELEKTLQVAADPHMGLVFVHFGLPHPPYAYNRQTQRFDLRNSAVNGYWDNLALVDRTVADIRRVMEAAGVWDETTLLITSDHAFRTSRALDGKRDKRVPFLLKLAGQQQGLELAVPFNNLLVHDLIGEILEQRVSTADQAAAWISAAAGHQPSELRHERRSGFDGAGE